jgi:hypothetical protein
MKNNPWQSWQNGIMIPVTNPGSAPTAGVDTNKSDTKRDIGETAVKQSNTTLNQAKEKVDADLKASEAVAEKDQADPARDKFLDLTEREREAVIEYLNIVTTVCQIQALGREIDA